MLSLHVQYFRKSQHCLSILVNLTFAMGGACVKANKTFKKCIIISSYSVALEEISW